MADPFQKLQRELQEAQKRAEEAEQRAERAEAQQFSLQQRNQSLQEQNQSLEVQNQSLEMQNQSFEERTRRTTLSKYLQLVHKHVDSQLTVERNKDLSTKGGITSSKGKLVPERLSYDDTFTDRQKEINISIHAACPFDGPRLFESDEFLRGLSERFREHIINSERSLELHEHLAVEGPVAQIIRALQAPPSSATQLDLRGPVRFENHLNVLQKASEIQEIPPPPQPTPVTPPHQSTDPSLPRLNIDQVCVYTADPNNPTVQEPRLIIEYKAPHKISPEQLRAGLRTVDIYNEVVQQPRAPSQADADARFDYFAKQLVATALVQLYNYMIRSGLSYSYLTTGEAFVFVRIDWDQPKILYYHLAEPMAEYAAALSPSRQPYCTAVCQVLDICLLALQDNKKVTQRARQEVIEKLQVWVTDDQAILDQMSDSDRGIDSSGSSGSRYKEPVTYSQVDRSPYNPRSSRCRPAGDTSNQRSSRSPSPDPPSDGPAAPQTTSKRPWHNRVTSDPPPDRRSTRSGRQYQFCTQACLLGVVRSSFLDPSCPNVHRHHNGVRGDLGDCYHLVNRDHLIEELGAQLNHDLDHSCEKLGLEGERAVLFKLTLDRLGYVLVGKGTAQGFRSVLLQEQKIYNHVQSIQGLYAPVCLGHFDIANPYFYDVGVEITNFLVQSWAGERVDMTDRECLEKSRTTVSQIHNLGVVHNDIHAHNLLSCQETNTVMLVDFGSAQILSPPKPNLQRVLRGVKRPRSKSSSSASPRKLRKINLFNFDDLYLEQVFSSLLWNPKARTSPRPQP